MNNSKEQGALHHQCIDELTSHIRIAAQQQHQPITSTKRESSDFVKVSKDSSSRSETPTSFVTVIEVKDSASSVCRSSQSNNVVTATSSEITPSAVTTTDIRSDMSSTLPSSTNLHMEPTSVTTSLNNEVGSAVTTTKLNSEDNNTSVEENTVSTSITTSTNTATSTTVANTGQNVEVRKKIPPR